jgi:hypothetical protein
MLVEAVVRAAPVRVTTLGGGAPFRVEWQDAQGTLA